MKKLTNNIYQIKIPFEDGYTSSFILSNNGECIIVDFGANDCDSNKYIIPQVRQLNLLPKYLVCTHNHPDHAGGINALTNYFPTSEILSFSPDFSVENKKIHIVSENMILLGKFKIITLPGHTDDSIGLLDIESNTLLCGDSLQGKGIEKCAININGFAQYIKTLKKVLLMNPTNLILSHNYEPFGGFIQNQTEEFINICQETLNDISDFVKSHINLPATEITKLLNKKRTSLLIGSWTVENAIRYLKSVSN